MIQRDLRRLLRRTNDRLEILHPENFTVLSDPEPIRGGSDEGWWVTVQVYMPDKKRKRKGKRK